MTVSTASGSPSAAGTEQSLLAASGYKFKHDEKKPLKIKLKRLSVQTKRETETNGVKDSNGSSGASSPILPRFDEDTMDNFPNGRPEPLETVICKHCKKVVLKRTAKEHVAGCLKSKQEKARKKKEAREAAQRAKERAERGDDDDDDDDEKGKKRKTDAGEDEKDSKKKKKKEEPKPKVAKPKGPVDVERQCGVTLPNGAQCARSLTCKSHSMGAKRAVPGRSLPYDMLLAQYQKKNQARQQKAAIDANAPLPFEDDLDPSLTGPIDSDEERDAVMTSIQRSLARPQPLVCNTLFPTRRKYQLVRMKEMLSNALSGNRGSGLFSVPVDNMRGNFPTPGFDGTFAVPQTMTPISAPTGVGMAQPGMNASSRKASIDVT